MLQTEALRGPGDDTCLAHRELIESVPLGMYENDAGQRCAVTRVERDFSAAGHEQYFVYYKTKPGTSCKESRRLLVGTGHGEKSGWFQYILKDGRQRQRYLPVL